MDGHDQVEDVVRRVRREDGLQRAPSRQVQVELSVLGRYEPMGGFDDSLGHCVRVDRLGGAGGEALKVVEGIGPRAVHEVVNRAVDARAKVGRRGHDERGGEDRWCKVRMTASNRDQHDDVRPQHQ